MKTWSAIIIAGSLLASYTINNPDGLFSKFVEAQTQIKERNTERLYAATNSSVSNSTGNSGLVYVTVRDHINKLRSSIPLECTNGYSYLQHIDDINASNPLQPDETADITEEVNRICGL